MRRDGAVASKHELLDEVWGPEFEGDRNIVEVYVGYLRRKIDDAVRRAHAAHRARRRLPDRRRRCELTTERTAGAVRAPRLLAPFEPVRVRITLAATLAFGSRVRGRVGRARAHACGTRSRRAPMPRRPRDAAVAAQLQTGTSPTGERRAGPSPSTTQVFDASGTVHLGSADADAVRCRHVGRRPRVDRRRPHDGSDVRRHLARGHGRRPGRSTIAIATPLTEVRRSVDTLAHSLWVGTPVPHRSSSALVGRGCSSAARCGRSRRSAPQVDEITGTTMHRRVPVPDTDDEVARLAAHDERRCSTGSNARRRASARFVSDASHELRSPRQHDPRRARGRVGRRRARRLARRSRDARSARPTGSSRLVDDLLALARLDEAQGPPTRDARRPRRPRARRERAHAPGAA